MKRTQAMKRLVALGSLLLIAGLLTGCAANNAGTETAAPARSISVTGFGEATGVPDMATVQLGVSVQDDNIGQAIDQSNQISGRVKQALLDFGIAETDIQSTNFNVYYTDEYDPATGQPTGQRTYHVDSTVSVMVRNIDQVSDAIQTGLDAGANNIYGLSYGIDNSKPLETQARTMALDDAHERAAQIASELGMTLGDPVVANELVSGGVLSVSQAALVRGLGGGGGGPPLSPGQLTVSIQVDVQYSVDG